MMTAMPPARLLRPPAALRAALAGLMLLPAAQDEDDAPRFSFSDGPLVRAWSLVATQAPADSARELRLPAEAGILGSPEEDWSEWARALERCSAAEPESSAARLWLSAFARQQSRDDDAWEHLAHAAGDPAGMRAALALLVPGVERSMLARGAWPRLPDDSLLAPALPPPAGPAAQVVLGTGRPRRGSSRCENFRVGAAVLSLSVTVESDGVQVELAHLSGGPARVRLLLPEAPDFALAVEYVDWVRQPPPRAPRAVALEPGGEPIALFGRFEPRKIAWPTCLPRGPSAQIDGPGLRIHSAAGDDLAGAARGLRILLGRPVEMRAGAPEAALEPFAGIVLDLREPDLKERKLSGIVSLAERFSLAAPR